MDALWRGVRSKKRIQKSFEVSTLRKQPKMNTYQLCKHVLITNTFEELEEELDDENNNIKVEKTTKLPLVFVAKINNFSSLS